MRILALDVGTKTIGVAVSDELQLTSNGLFTINRKSIKKDLQALGSIVEEYCPGEVVVGLPYREDGSLSKRGKDIEAFSEKIGERFKVPVVFFDESYSTVFAEKALIEGDVGRKKRKKIIDKMAAVVILQDYLDRLKN